MPLQKANDALPFAQRDGSGSTPDINTSSEKLDRGDSELDTALYEVARRYTLVFSQRRFERKFKLI